MLAQRLDDRIYTSVADFSRDFLRAVGEVLAPRLSLDNPSDVDVEAIYSQLNEVQPGTAEHMALTQEQKDLKRLAKRIVKAVKEPLEGAARKEAELRGRELEEEMRKLDSMGIFASTASKSMEVDGEDIDTQEKRRSGSDVSAIAGASPEVHANGDTDMLDADGPPIEDAMHQDSAQKNNVVPFAANRYTPVSKAGSYTSSIADRSRRTRNGAEPLSPSISRSSSGPNGVAPSSSADSNQALSDSHDVFAQGGVPWYLEPFDPVGTTIHDERYTGRAVLRDMSEELSDMDEDTLTELQANGVEATPKATQTNGTSSGATNSPATVKKSNVKKKKARRNFWSRSR